MNNFETIRNENRLLFEYVRGSHLYGLANENSDVDTGGIFISDLNSLLGTGIHYQNQVSDTNNDTTWYEIGRLMNLLVKSNPTVLESLFIPKEFILTEPSPILNELFENRDKFLTKECFNALIGYSVSQIKKARGLNKKIVNPINERKTPFDFTYTFSKQGSVKISEWLKTRGLKNEFCGLVNIPNMENIYGVYYDWGAHFKDSGINDASELCEKEPLMYRFIDTFYHVSETDGFHSWFKKNREPLGYRGMCLEGSNEMRFSSVAKEGEPICCVAYNENGYRQHCIKYSEYKQWEKNRNQARYESNLNKTYDSKNIMHCFRLMHMGKEIAEGQGMILNRTWDREFLLDVRNHKYEYDEIIDILQNDKDKMDKAMENSTIPEKIDVEFVNELLVNIRKKRYQI